ncbi:exonuclease subunit SbcC [Pannus brasiliensis CCIBt3594]|uniref:Nuclease SbcCD subunit C n=1 Tax=Pannus brasiliensis CCIBt3594 TaxID=1427578 RepID=A0AAW9QQJ8_9CHRO
MIPLQLTLQNFFSYREATLDFRGLHTACICGANGAGKSSLLEAMSWAIWGESRAASEDDVIHAGTDHVRVDFQFHYGEQTYRVIRGRQRGGKAVSLDFQVKNGDKFLSLTGKRIKDTQEQIDRCLKLDYRTFVNSAYLRQGQADEFMKQNPSGRKQILAELLQLDRYETLAIKAKDLSKQFEGQMQQLERSLEPIERGLEERGELERRLQELEAEINRINSEQELDRARLQRLEGEQYQRKTWQDRLDWQENQVRSISEDLDRLSRERSGLERQLTQLATTIARKDEIVTSHDRLLQLQHENELLSSKFQELQTAQLNKQQIERQLQRQENEFTLEIQKTSARLESLGQQEKEIGQILAQSANVNAGLEQLNIQRQRLVRLEELYLQVTPLLARRTTLNLDIERARASLVAKIEQLQQRREGLQEELDRVPALRDQALRVAAQLQELEKKQVYYKRVEEKGNASKGAKQSLSEKQLLHEEQITELSDKLSRLNVPDSVCPLCEQDLDSHHRHQVIEKTNRQQQLLQEQIWEIQEQLAAIDRDVVPLRQEYKRLKQELQEQPLLQQKYGQLEARLEASEDREIELEEIERSISELQSRLDTGHYALDLQAESRLVDREIAGLQYDEQTHALVRGEEKRWRWAEIKQAEIKSANTRLANLNLEKPKLTEKLERLEREKRELLERSPLQQEIQRLERSIQELGYDRSRHQDIQNLLRELEGVRVQYQDLQQAERSYPEIQARIEEVQRRIELREEDREKTRGEIEALQRQLASLTDYRQEIAIVSAGIENRQRQHDEFVFQKGRIEEGIARLEAMESDYRENQEQLARVRRQYRVYVELAKAFGKNGLQTLMIENVLPQLEAQTNQILARLTGNQFHVQFVTQKAGKGTKKRQQKLIDTLDIIISDARGSRPYETYSGGEAFRINFSIRLALARLLAQRAGTALQMLIVDEGFGTQDAEGCDRLIAAINAIAPDFACILTVTHIPQFKEAFQHRIEVRKSDRGSQLVLLS